MASDRLANCDSSKSPRIHVIPSPKLNSLEKSRAFYPYYAGFSESFVSAMLDYLGVREGSTILDPWNGSGTTTCLASKRGAAAIGYDLNPVLTIVARARSASTIDAELAGLAWRRVKKHLSSTGTVLEHCTRIYSQILGGPGVSRRVTLTEGARALILCSLLGTVRKNFQHAKTRNPAWFSDVGEPGAVDCDAVILEVTSELARISHCIEYYATLETASVAPILHTADFLTFDNTLRSVDTILTSPPYLTRLDYVKATLPELMLLGRFSPICIKHLRLQMMGSPLVGNDAPSAKPAWGSHALEIVEMVAAHPSKASSSYYLRFFLKYFSALELAISRMSKIIRPNGRACLVVQSSYYKEILVDLPTIVQQMGEANGFLAVSRFDFAWNRSIAGINTRASTAGHSAIESAVLLEYQEGQ